MHTYVVTPNLETPLINDPAVRQQLVAWFRAHAAAWHRQADGLQLWQEASVDLVSRLDAQVRALRGKADVCREFARQLEDVATTDRQTTAVL